MDGDGDRTGGDPHVVTFQVDLTDGLVFEGRHNDHRVAATALTFTEVIEGSNFFTAFGQGSQDPINTNQIWRDPDWWSFEAEAGDRVAIAVDTPNSSADPYVELYNSSFSRVSNDSDGGPDNDAYISHYTIPEDGTGTYYIVVGTNQRNIPPDNYQIRLELARGIDLESDHEFSNRSSIDPIFFAEDGNAKQATVGGTVMSSTDADRFSLGVLNAGVVVELDAESLLPSESTLHPWVRVLNSRGEPLPDEDGNPLDGRYRVTIPDNDTYSAELRSFWTYEENRYALTNISSSWEAVEAEAVAVGGHLVTINDLEENDWLQQTFSPFGELWIGLNDRDVEGTFVWSSGEVADYENWLGGQPAGGTNENFVVMRLDGLWDDRHTTHDASWSDRDSWCR